MAKIVYILVVALVASMAVICYGQARYPAGVNPASCPNYPFCNTAGIGAPAGYVFDSRLGYPAGINPAACPYYPYC